MSTLASLHRLGLFLAAHPLWVLSITTLAAVTSLLTFAGWLVGKAAAIWRWGYRLCAHRRRAAHPRQTRLVVVVLYLERLSPEEEL